MNDFRRIVVAGLSPAWQQIVLLDALHLGEVNRAAEVHWCASGKALNVGRALHALGSLQTTVALVGGSSGQQIQAEWAAESLDARWVHADRPTRVCTTLIQRSTGMVTELVENAADVGLGELHAFERTYRLAAGNAALVVLTGSLPAGAPQDWWLRALTACPCPAILDVRGPELMAALPARPLLVKPNREELGRTVGRNLAGEAETWTAIQELLAMGAQWALVTQGTGPALLAGAGGRWRVLPHRVTSVNPIGCGDCLAAGIAANLVQQAADVSSPTIEEMLAAVRHGMAAAAENAGTILPAQLNRRRVEELAHSIAMQAIEANSQ